MRPISNVVDVTNYVMLALGSPLHAFDYDTLAGGRIVVRRARPGEELETLDGTKRELDPQDLVIADAERPIGDRRRDGRRRTPRCPTTTTSVLLEAANFEPLTVLRSGERHRMRTESQTRWEKGVDPELAGARGDVRVAAARRSSRARAGPARREVRGELRAAGRDRLPARRTRTTCSGSRSPEAEQRERLERLGFDGRRTTGRCTRPTLARARRAPRHRRRRGGRALPARGRARDAARRGRRCSAG